MSKRAHEHSKKTLRQSNIPDRQQQAKEQSKIQARKKEELLFKNKEIEEVKELEEEKKSVASSPDAP